VVTTPIAWSSTGGHITADGTFSSTTPGTFKVIGRGRHGKQADTAVVIVVPPTSGIVRIVTTPDTVTLSPGGNQRFAVTGYLSDGSSATVGVNWSASGGDIDAAGVYTADSIPGTYRVVAASTAGTLSDTSLVTITASAPTLLQIYVTPVSVSLSGGASQWFKVYGRNSVGDSIPVTVKFSASGGTVTTAGLFTAGSTGGAFHVVAKDPMTGKADTAAVTVSALGTIVEQGIPYGSFALWSGSAPKWGPAPFTVSVQSDDPSGIVTRIATARSLRQSLVLGIPGLGHAPYLTNGAFDITKWKAQLDKFNTATIRQAVAEAVSDGTVIGNAIMDEPEHSSWGGVMTKPLLDQMATYAKQYFPTLPMGVDHTTMYPSWRTSERYHVVDYIWSPPLYWNTLAKGVTIAAWRDAVVAQATLDGVRVAWGLNPLDGGIQAVRDGLWNCPITASEGRGTFAPNCRMTADQVRDWGRTLAQSPSCFLIMWRYDATYMGRADNQQAFNDLASTLRAKPRTSCRRP
jgi:hypothetical protein